MKIKGIIVSIVFAFFAGISGLGFLILASTVDVPDGKLKWWLLAVLAWVICVLISVFLYDQRLIFRHLFAIYSLILLINGWWMRSSAKKYQFVYEVMSEVESFRDFYCFMLYWYDENHKS